MGNGKMARRVSLTSDALKALRDLLQIIATQNEEREFEEEGIVKRGQRTFMPACYQNPTLEQIKAFLTRISEDGLSREEMQRMLRSPRARGPQLTAFGEHLPTLFEVKRNIHPSEIVKECGGLVTSPHINYAFGSPPDGVLDLPATLGFYSLTRPIDGKVQPKPSDNSLSSVWDTDGHLHSLGLNPCDIWDLLEYYKRIGSRFDWDSLPENFRIITTTNHGFTETGHYYVSSAQFIFALLYKNKEGKPALGFNQYPTSYVHDAWTDNAYILGRCNVD